MLNTLKFFTKKYMNVVILLLAIGTLAGCSTRSGPPADVEYDQNVTPYHTVRKGDSIASIARKYGMDKRELVRINGLASPYRIVSGQRLLVKAHARKGRKRSRSMDESEAPATENVGSVPSDSGVSVRPLAPIAGVASKGVAVGAGAIEQNGFAKAEQNQHINPEVDDEADYDAPSQASKQKYDDDMPEDATPNYINAPDTAGEVSTDSKMQKGIDQPSKLPSAPASAGSYTWPAQGKVVRDFSSGGKGKTQNDGINIIAAKGTPVVAANNGVVAHAGNQLRGFGNVVLVKHDGGMMTVYAHLDKVSVKKGEVIKAGQRLGSIGQTGTVKEPQLHFEIRKGRKPVDPNQYLQ